MLTMKRLFYILLVVATCIVLPGCKEKTPAEHVCRLFEIEEVDGTCISEGVIAHSICIYCKTRYLDGKVITDFAKAKDENNHQNIIFVPEQSVTCSSNGLKAHEMCNDCGTYFIDNAVVSENDLISMKTNGHEYGPELTCTKCDAYKLVYNDREYVCDSSTRIPFLNNEVSITHNEISSKGNVLSSALVNRMTFSSQGQSILKVENLVDTWKISQYLSESPSKSYTRFALGDDKGEAYEGKCFIGFDIFVHQETKMSAFGLRVVDSNGDDVYKESQSLLFGNDVNEKNEEMTMEVGKIYRFAYEVETTDVNQIIQIWTVSATKKLDISISNLYVILLGDGTSEVPTATSSLKVIDRN